MGDNIDTNGPRVAIVGGGLAGLAAAMALVTRGCQVELFEAKRKLGGRAGSYVDPASGQQIDHCQHVAMGCCTNFVDFCRRTGILGLLSRQRTLHFFGPDGRRSDFRPARWLPAPLHLVGPLLRLSYLSLLDKLSIARGMLKLIGTPREDTAGRPTVLEWLHEQRQSPAAIERFWKVVLVSALAESLDRASLAAARKVFVDGFLAHPDAADLLVPAVSLSELYDRRVTDWLRERGATIRLESPVETVGVSGERAARLQMADGRLRDFEFVILAVPWRRLGDLLSPALLEAVDPGRAVSAIVGAPISSVHLWFDKRITELPHAVLIERLSQWVFARGSQQAREHYYQVVISASHDLAGRERQSVVDEIVADLRSVFPAAKHANLVRWQLITDPQAVFSARPGLDQIRPPQQTSIANLLLAGDWTATGWPATMEGAVRSGYLAAEAVLKQLGRAEQIVVADLPRGWMAKAFRL